MVLWELGKGRASLITGEGQALEEREHSLGISHRSQMFVKMTFYVLTVLSFPREG